MNNNVNEKAFEDFIEASLLEKGSYIKGYSSNFSRELAFDKSIIFEFLKSSQPKEWEKSAKIHEKDAENKIIQRLFKELDNRGTLDILRNGFIDFGVKYKMAFFKPETSLNPEAFVLYNKNILTVTRQVKYSEKNENSVDIVLSINGLPVATLELKNQFTGQNTENAKKQFIYDRDNRELLFQFKKRALVHFAVDTDEVYMTTKLDGTKTRYLPFNKGNNKGAGNSTNLNGHKTAYLWENILSKDTLMEIVGKFLHLQVEEYIIDGKKIKKENMIFPRFHQLDVVKKLVEDARKNGAGKNYLIQHSAGSGKSNSIAWLTYRLSSLHNAEDKRVFDSVIVITDRKILDNQLQNTIYQFEHKQGVVQKIDKDSAQLADAISNGKNIVITTLQKFPYILDKIGEIGEKNYAVIVDEAHSSQGGEATKKLKEALTVINMNEIREEESEYNKIDDNWDEEDEIRKSMIARGMHKNLSFFAFTATPKSKTLEVFGEKNEEGKPEPFHLYSMRQAIEEGFIMDVLKNYTTYKTFFRLAKQIEDDPQMNKKKASRAIAKYMELHPYNLAQKTEVIIEHFRQSVMKKIGGKAKAMVVTSSRAHVVRYKQEFDRYIKEKKYNDIKALIAFSGTVRDEYGVEYTEVGMNNGIKEKELPEKFDTDEYKLLLVADKYQTGFDQPLLHTMYVDKRLSGVKTVQTLSRLNRTCAGKEDTFILDFINDREEILKSFQPYYEITTIKENTDPNHLYDLKSELEKSGVLIQSEIDVFCKIFFTEKDINSKKIHGELNYYIDMAVDRFKNLEDEEKKDKFKHTLNVYLRLYSFLSQIMPFRDIELEKLNGYGRFLLTKLPKNDIAEKLKLNNEVALEYYRLQKMSEGSIQLEIGGENELIGIRDAGKKKDEDEKALLSDIINVLNDRFGTDFNEADKLFFDQIEAELISDETLVKQAKNNSIDNFKYGFEDVFLKKMIDRMEQNQDIFAKIMDDNAFASIVKEWMLKKVYNKLSITE